MKALILAAGYATRLYPLTKDKPKPLLKVGDKAIVEHILDKLKFVEEVSEIFIITNNCFYNHFEQWLNEYSFPKKIKIINDQTLSNEDRLGAVGDLHFALKKECIDEDTLVIAGDNLFGFSLDHFVDFFKQKQSSIVAFCDLKNIEKVRGKLGVGILEGDRLIDFEEKPENPKSTSASTACYLFTKSDLKLIDNFVKQERADNSGDLVKHLVNLSKVHGFVFDDHWFDIGSFDSLREAEDFYCKNEN